MPTVERLFLQLAQAWASSSPRLPIPIMVPLSGPVAATIQEIWKMRDACFSPPWFGMKMTITSQGAVDVDFNYDPTCTSDPAFRAN